MANFLLLVACLLAGWVGNTSFVGLPMIETLHGRDGLGLGLLIDQLGSYLALSTLGVAPDMTSRVSVIEAAMPPLIGAGVVAAQANLAPRLVSMMVGVGIPLGLVTACGWHWLFGWLAG